MTSSSSEWTVEDHLRAGTPETIALFRELRSTLESLGPITTSVSKTTVTFKGPRRGFAGGRPLSKGVVGYLDLMRQLPDDRRIRSISPYGRNLFVHHYILTDAGDLDEEFSGWLREAYAVGCGAHLRN
ncbi:MAG TPA: DUF5655 domain-containing protein [Galbitalea sp.]|nr:DUF5655 domain-containing protein [Galbitalea sp.]